MNFNKILAKNKKHLICLINSQIELYGDNCDLNHIDISAIDDLTNLFGGSYFNGNISQWNVSHVKFMDYMFEESLFNGDISSWNVSKVKKMKASSIKRSRGS